MLGGPPPPPGPRAGAATAGDTVTQQHPRTLVVAGPEVAGDVRQCHVRNAGVEHFHEGGERDHDGDQPRVVSRTPGLGGCAAHDTWSQSATSSRKTFSISWRCMWSSQ